MCKDGYGQTYRVPRHCPRPVALCILVLSDVHLNRINRFGARERAMERYNMVKCMFDYFISTRGSENDKIWEG